MGGVDPGRWIYCCHVERLGAATVVIDVYSIDSEYMDVIPLDDEHTQELSQMHGSYTFNKCKNNNNNNIQTILVSIYNLYVVYNQLI